MRVAIFIFFLAHFLLYNPILEAEEYSHHWFVITWPNGFCSGNACRSKIPQNLVIHGLWPAYSSGVIPTACRLNPIKDILHMV